VVLEKSPLDRTIADEDLSEIKTVATILDGEIVHGVLETDQ
jgi:hypothetical protein